MNYGFVRAENIGDAKRRWPLAWSLYVAFKPKLWFKRFPFSDSDLQKAHSELMTELRARAIARPSWASGGTAKAVKADFIDGILDAVLKQLGVSDALRPMMIVVLRLLLQALLASVFAAPKMSAFSTPAAAANYHVEDLCRQANAIA